MQARHSVISLAALGRSIRRLSVVNNMSAPVSRSFLYRAVAKISVLVRSLRAGLAFDELDLIAQPLGLGRGGVAPAPTMTDPRGGEGICDLPSAFKVDLARRGFKVTSRSHRCLVVVSEDVVLPRRATKRGIDRSRVIEALESFQFRRVRIGSAKRNAVRL
jgi:hypothetical protein